MIAVVFSFKLLFILENSDDELGDGGGGNERGDRDEYPPSTSEPRIDNDIRVLIV